MESLRHPHGSNSTLLTASRKLEILRVNHEGDADVLVANQFGLLSDVVSNLSNLWAPSRSSAPVNVANKGLVEAMSFSSDACSPYGIGSPFGASPIPVVSGTRLDPSRPPAEMWTESAVIPIVGSPARAPFLLQHGLGLLNMWDRAPCRFLFSRFCGVEPFSYQRPWRFLPIGRRMEMQLANRPRRLARPPCRCPVTCLPSHVITRQGGGTMAGGAPRRRKGLPLGVLRPLLKDRAHRPT